MSLSHLDRIIFRSPLSQFDGTTYNGFKPDACIQNYTELDPVLDDILGSG